MTGFSAEWLAMREPVDAVSRDPSITRRLSQLSGASSRCLDLGCGTGANLRYLAPRIAGAQEWVLLDLEEPLLEEARAQAAAWRSSVRTILSIETRRIDLARELEAVALQDGAIVAASALLDLVSSDWLRQLLERCRAHSAIVLFALTYDGRIELTPAEPDDGSMRELVNRHQGTDKGFGPALGPRAVGVACSLLGELGYQVQVGASDWVLGPPHSRVQEYLLRGWARAAMDLAPSERGRCQRWLQSRLQYLDRGESFMRIGHQDVIGWPRHRPLAPQAVP